MIRSRGLFVRRLRQCSCGKAKELKVSSAPGALEPDAVHEYASELAHERRGQPRLDAFLAAAVALDDRRLERQRAQARHVEDNFPEKISPTFALPVRLVL
ncbi:hypothetical protein LLG95_03335 [bacterium]|nr:hypothetical protein [bacterium]